MTAEIAILNKTAIALAADSAVTIEGGSEQKNYYTVHKLFALSKFAPVGIMVFGAGDFLNLPWEIIVKSYRQNLETRRFNYLKEYADDFIAFLQTGNSLFPESEQIKYMVASTSGFFNHIIKKDIEKAVTYPTDIQKVKETISKIIKDNHSAWKKVKLLPGIPTTHADKIIKKYTKELKKVIKNVFKDLPLTTNAKIHLLEIAGFLFTRNIFANYQSGVVIAGFGDKEYFPSVRSYAVEGKLMNRLKYKEEDRSPAEIGFNNSAAIMPFAQKDMVDTFITGVNPNFENVLLSFLKVFYEQYPDTIASSMDKYNQKEKKKFVDALKNISNKEFNKLVDNLKSYIRDMHIEPILDAVSFLPKDELAEMAEALVNLTSFKQRVSMEKETVGGPIDVAIISKGDGFVWIKRKHYFKAELNPNFLANYYRIKDDMRKKK